MVPILGSLSHLEMEEALERLGVTFSYSVPLSGVEGKLNKVTFVVQRNLTSWDVYSSVL